MRTLIEIVGSKGESRADEQRLERLAGKKLLYAVEYPKWRECN